MEEQPTTPQQSIQEAINRIDIKGECRASFRIFRLDGTIETFESDDVRIISPEEVGQNGDSN